MFLTPGTRLGVYEITAQIGEGGMGAVYRATDTSLSRQVAIKVLPDAFAADPDHVRCGHRDPSDLVAGRHADRVCLEPGAPVVLVPTRIVGAVVDGGVGRQYDVAPDGRFLINKELPGDAAPITLIQHWTPEANR